jgi:uncharacterized protein YcfL
MIYKCFLLTIAISLLFFIGANAQSEWKMKAEQENVLIKAKTVSCNDVANGTHKEVVLIQIENKAATPIEVSFKKETWYNNICTTCNKNSAEHKVTVQLGANEIMESSCNSNKQLNIFSKMLDMKKSELTKFELKDITITPAK